MSNLKINIVTKEIEITKAFERKASKVGTREYAELVKVMHDFVGFNVVIKATAAKENSHKGLTVAYMDKLVAGMTGNNVKAIQDFNAVKDFYKDTNFSFSKVKEYFLTKYSNYKEFVARAEDEKEERNTNIVNLESEVA